MKLTQYSDLGLRLLMYLALRHGETSTIQEVSERFAVSKNHMVKISHQLTKSGLIESLRGRNGGVRLARPPDNFDLVECFNPGQNRCVISDVCKLSGVLDRARTAFFTVLRDVSLADLVSNSAALNKTLLPLSSEMLVSLQAKTLKMPPLVSSKR
jgi:Rrf2 family transcriptional regulator, nitric oxide-sensitive transcriptional repressor